MKGKSTGDLTKLPWLTGGDGVWFLQNLVKHNDAYAGQSPVLGDNQSSYLEVTLDVPSAGTVSFWHKVSSAAGDSLIFTLDGVEQERWSGEADWAYSGYAVSTPGIHTFRWEYAKDGSGSAGSDAGWLDNITFPPLWTGHPFGDPLGRGQWKPQPRHSANGESRVHDPVHGNACLELSY